MDVVAHGGAVGRGEVGAEHLDGRPEAQRGLHHERHQVVRDGEVLADHGVGRRARRVEVAQAHPAQPVHHAVPLQQLLGHQLALPVRALGPQRRALAHRQLGGVAVHRAGAREHEGTNRGALDGAQQPRRGHHVVLEVLAGDLHRLARVLVAGEVDDAVDPVFVDHAPHERGVAGIAHHERCAEQRGGVPGLHAVEHHHGAAPGAQLAHRVAADVARSARHEHRHGRLLADPCPSSGRVPQSIVCARPSPGCAGPGRGRNPMVG